MDVLYRCCQCDEDVTERVRRACNRVEDFPTLTLSMGNTEAGGLSIRGHLPGSDSRVMIECSNGHLCSYPCAVLEQD